MPVTVNKIDTSVVAETLRQQIREDVAIVPGARPRLVGFLANKDPAARKYAEWTGRAPGTMATSSLICWRSVSATTLVSILFTDTGISPFDCGELGVLAEPAHAGAEQLVGSRLYGGAAVI